MVGLCAMVRGGVLPHKHFQMVVKGNFNSVPMWRRKIKVCLGWGGMRGCIPSRVCLGIV